VGFGYEYLDAGETVIDQEGEPLQGSLKVEHDTKAIHFFAVHLSYPKIACTQFLHLPPVIQNIASPLSALGY